MTKIFKSAIIFLIILTSGCKKTYITSPEQEILFQMDVINYDPEYNHYGYIIDSRGNILSYDNPENWYFNNINFNITADQVASNISKCIKAGQIADNELLKFSSYIDNIASSKLSAMKRQENERRTVQFLCYKYSGSSHIYKGYIIKTEGDYSGENLNFYSKKVVAWMKGLNAPQ